MFHLLKKTVQPFKILLNSKKFPTINNVSSFTMRQPQFHFSNQLNANYSKRTIHNGLPLQGIDWTNMRDKSILKQSKSLSPPKNCIALGQYSSSGFFELVGMFVVGKWVLGLFLSLFEDCTQSTRTTSSYSIRIGTNEEDTDDNIETDPHQNQQLNMQHENYINIIFMYRSDPEKEKRSRVARKMERIFEKLDNASSEFQDVTLQSAVNLYRKLQKAEWKVKTFLQTIDVICIYVPDWESLKQIAAKDKLAWSQELRVVTLRLTKIMKDYDELDGILAHINL